MVFFTSSRRFILLYLSFLLRLTSLAAVVMMKPVFKGLTKEKILHFPLKLRGLWQVCDLFNHALEKTTAVNAELSDYSARGLV